MLLFMRKTGAACPRTRLQPSIVAVELSCTEGGLGTDGCERNAAHRPPPTAGSWPIIATKS